MTNVEVQAISTLSHAEEARRRRLEARTICREIIFCCISPMRAPILSLSKDETLALLAPHHERCCEWRLDQFMQMRSCPRNSLFPCNCP
jgi:hypothetical protein